MKGILGLVVGVAVLAVGGWYVAVKLPSQRAAERAERAAAAELAARAEREALFGPEATAPDVQWRETGLGYRILAEGTGSKPFPGARVLLNYVGRLKNGTEFDRSRSPTEFRVGGMVPGLSAGVQLLAPGGKGIFFIPPKLAYGGQKVGGIPPHSGLIFEVELVALNP